MNIEEAKRCVGKGWHGLINELFDRMPEGTNVYSIKEKYGTLRIDCIPGSDLEIELERKSSTICEECGENGETRDLPWIRTLCDGCYKRTVGGI